MPPCGIEEARQMMPNIIFHLQGHLKMVLAYAAITQTVWYGSDIWFCMYYGWKKEKKKENVAAWATHSATDKEACHCDDCGLHLFFFFQSSIRSSLQLVAITNHREFTICNRCLCSFHTSSFMTCVHVQRKHWRIKGAGHSRTKPALTRVSPITVQVLITPLTSVHT